MSANNLTHFGVLGMKWGRRKGTASSAGKGKKKRVNDHLTRSERRKLSPEAKAKLTAKRAKAIRDAKLKRVDNFIGGVLYTGFAAYALNYLVGDAVRAKFKDYLQGAVDRKRARAAKKEDDAWKRGRDPNIIDAVFIN